jgi:hypothetical protein
MAAAPVLSKK